MDRVVEEFSGCVHKLEILFLAILKFDYLKLFCVF